MPTLPDSQLVFFFELILASFFISGQLCLKLRPRGRCQIKAARNYGPYSGGPLIAVPLIFYVVFF